MYGIILIYSEFDDKYGPVPKFYVPSDLVNKKMGLAVSMKSINIYTEEELDGHKSLAVIPFPTQNKKGIVKSIEWNDEKVRGGIGSGALTLLFDESNDSIFYKYMKDIEIVFDKVIERIIELKSTKAEEEDVFNEINQFYDKTLNLLNELKEQEGVQDESEAFPDDDVKEEKIKYVFKIVICGDPACGKTSTVLRFTDKAFRRTYIPTLGVNITQKTIDIEHEQVRLVLWDIAGQSKFQITRRQFYVGASAIILLFDLTRLKTFKSVPNWYQDIKKNLIHKGELLAFLCGNKNDLKDERMISSEEGKKMGKELNMKYFETSALTGDNINQIFHNLAIKMLEDYKREIKQ